MFAQLVSGLRCLLEDTTKPEACFFFLRWLAEPCAVRLDGCIFMISQQHHDVNDDLRLRIISKWPYLLYRYIYRYYRYYRYVLRIHIYIYVYIYTSISLFLGQSWMGTLIL